jgi:hypothetical protein
MVRMLTELDDARWVDEIWFLPSLTALLRLGRSEEVFIAISPI